MIVALMICHDGLHRKGLGRVHINSPEGIDDIDKSGKIHPKIIGDFRVIEIFQRPLRHVYTVKSRMGQLVLCPAGNSQRHIVIPGCGQQQNLLCLRVDRHNDIYIAAGSVCHAAVSVNAAQIHREVIRIIGRLSLRLLHFLLDGYGNDGPDFRQDILIPLHILRQGQEGMVDQHSADLSRPQSVDQRIHSGVLRQLQRKSRLLLYLPHGVIRIFPIQFTQNTDGVTLNVRHLLGRIILKHEDRDRVGFQRHRTDNLLYRRIRVIEIIGTDSADRQIDDGQRRPEKPQFPPAKENQHQHNADSRHGQNRQGGHLEISRQYGQPRKKNSTH